MFLTIYIFSFIPVTVFWLAVAATGGEVKGIFPYFVTLTPIVNTIYLVGIVIVGGFCFLFLREK